MHGKYILINCKPAFYALIFASFALCIRVFCVVAPPVFRAHRICIFVDGKREVVLHDAAFRMYTLAKHVFAYIYFFLFTKLSCDRRSICSWHFMQPFRSTFNTYSQYSIHNLWNGTMARVYKMILLCFLSIKWLLKSIQIDAMQIIA